MAAIADAADALEADSEAATDVESLPLEPGRSDVVRLMNLHKAKGLEADVVFLADPAGGIGQWVDVHIKRDGAKSLGWFKVEWKSETSFASKVLGEHADWEQHKAAEEPFLTAEENRLLYVAATRARQMLVVSRSASGKGKPAWGVLNQALAAAKELPVPKQVKVETFKPASSSAMAQAEAVVVRTSSEAKAADASWSITSVTAEDKHIAKMVSTADSVATDDPTVVVANDTPSHRAEAGMAWGTLIHGLLEHAMRHKTATREDLRRLALWLTVEEPKLRPVIAHALDTVEYAAKADFWAEAQSHIHSVETPFAVTHRARVTAGVIDLLFESEAGWHVVDYKTDHALEKDRYCAQLDTYRNSLGLLGCVVAAATVVNVRN